MNSTVEGMMIETRLIISARLRVVTNYSGNKICFGAFSKKGEFWHKNEKKIVTVTNIWDTDNRAVFLDYNRRPICWSDNQFLSLYYFLVTIAIFVTVTK